MTISDPIGKQGIVDKFEDLVTDVANASIVCPIVKAATVVLNIAATIIEPGILFNPCFL